MSSLPTRPKDNSHRKFPGERGPRQDRAAAKREDAVVRNEAWAALSPGKQLSRLNDRLGIGIGATRQRARIARSNAA